MHSTFTTLRRTTSYSSRTQLAEDRPFGVHIKDSSLGRAPSPSLTADDLFTEYDTVLHSIADRFAPVYEVRSRVRPHSPWFDAECRATRRASRKLERRYRRTKTDNDRSVFYASPHVNMPSSQQRRTGTGRNELLKNGANQRSSGGRCLRFCIGTTQSDGIVKAYCR